LISLCEAVEKIGIRCHKPPPAAVSLAEACFSDLEAEKMSTVRIDTESRNCDVLVIGGGLAGLTAAALLSRAGRSVVVLEKGNRLGGRGATTVRDGTAFNLGPHALYCGGDAYRILQNLEVPFSGGKPRTEKLLVLKEGRPHRFPQGLAALVASSLFSWRDKLRLARFPKQLDRFDPRSLDQTPLAQWIAEVGGHGNFADVMKMFFRLSTYSADIERLSAGAAIDQFRAAFTNGVLYLDGGWQTLIDGLRAIAASHHAHFESSARATQVTTGNGSVIATLADGRTVTSRAAIITTDPDTACDLLGLTDEAPLARWTAARTPIRAACLDLALRSLPQPERLAAFGLDCPLYFSVHSAAARLAPEGIAVVHVARYIPSGDSLSAEATERQLENLMDTLQPGWRDQILARRYLPHMIVTQSHPDAAAGGLSGRPPVTVQSHPGVFLAGDWVGARGMLADAAAASAEEAAQQVLEHITRPTRANQTRIPAEEGLVHGSR
jgi:phytoene dehydrogenase-like protein